MVKARDWDWLCFQRRKLIGSHIIQFKCEAGFERLYDAGIITNVKMQNDFYQLDVDGKNWFMYSFDIILPELTEDGDNIILHDKIADIRCIILTRKADK